MDDRGDAVVLTLVSFGLMLALGWLGLLQGLKISQAKPVSPGKSFWVVFMSLAEVFMIYMLLNCLYGYAALLPIALLNTRFFLSLKLGWKRDLFPGFTLSLGAVLGAILAFHLFSALPQMRMF